MIGAGFMGRGIVNQIANYMPGMELVAIANRTAKHGLDAYSKAGVEAKEVSSLTDLNQSIADGKDNRNPIGFYMGAQDGVQPAQHYDIVPVNGAGGVNKVTGDYLFHDQGSFGNTSGLWGILRVE